MIWKDPNKEEPMQSVPLLVILKYADLTWGDGGTDVGYMDDFGFQGSRQFKKEDIQYWCYLREILEEHPLPFSRRGTITNDAWIHLALKDCESK